MDEIIAELLGQDWDRLSDDELLESVRRVESWSRQLYAVTLAMTKEVDARGLAGRQGVSSTAVLLRQLLRLSPRAAKRRVEDATDVCGSMTVSGSPVASRLPGAAAALRSGVLSDEQLGVVRRALRELPDEVPLATRIQIERQLVSEAERSIRASSANWPRASAPISIQTECWVRSGMPLTGWSCRSSRTSTA